MQIERGIVLSVIIRKNKLTAGGNHHESRVNVSTAKCIYVYHLKEAVSKVSHPCRLHFMKLTAHIF